MQTRLIKRDEKIEMMMMMMMYQCNAAHPLLLQHSFLKNYI